MHVFLYIWIRKEKEAAERQRDEDEELLSQVLKKEKVKESSTEDYMYVYSTNIPVEFEEVIWLIVMDCFDTEFCVNM